MGTGVLQKSLPSSTSVVVEKASPPRAEWVGTFQLSGWPGAHPGTLSSSLALAFISLVSSAPRMLFIIFLLKQFSF